MYIQNQDTPNPNAVKFLPGLDVSPNEPIFFKNLEEATNSSLARKLLSIKDVVSVFFGSNFITITKIDDSKWEFIKPEVIIIVMDHYRSGLTALDNVSQDAEARVKIDTKHLPEIEKQIIELIDTKVRPAVAMDGGDISYVSFIDGQVTLRLKGACSGCPSASITLKNGIESMLKHYIPEITEVIAEEENKLEPMQG